MGFRGGSRGRLFFLGSRKGEVQMVIVKTLEKGKINSKKKGIVGSTFFMKRLYWRYVEVKGRFLLDNKRRRLVGK